MPKHSTVWWTAFVVGAVTLALSWATAAHGSVNLPERPKVHSIEKSVLYPTNAEEIVAAKEEVLDRLFIHGCRRATFFTREMEGERSGLVLAARCTRWWRH